MLRGMLAERTLERKTQSKKIGTASRWLTRKATLYRSEESSWRTTL